MNTTTQLISAEFPFKSKYLDVLNSKMHYIDEGQGDPVIFIHGMPTSSYLWRNIIPTLLPSSRCIALDLIGMGKSDKPEIEYSVFDHIKYFESFMEKLSLDKVTLVMHGWGSVIGLAYAKKYPDKIKGLAFIEPHLLPAITWQQLSLPVQELASLLKTKDDGYELIMKNNFFVDKVMRSGVMVQIRDEIMEFYRKPFQTESSRKVFWQYLKDLPLGSGHSDVVKLIQENSEWLATTTIPKLLIYGIPGFIVTMDTVMWAKKNLKNLKLADIGEMMHYVEEVKPNEVSDALASWYFNL